MDHLGVVRSRVAGEWVRWKSYTAWETSLSVVTVTGKTRMTATVTAKVAGWITVWGSVGTLSSVSYSEGHATRPHESTRRENVTIIVNM